MNGVWDIECAGWTHPVVVVTLHRTEGVAVHRTVGEAVQRMQRLGGRWWSHNGGQYDTLAALEFMRAGGIERLINYAQGRVTRSTGDGLTLSDSYALIPLGLDAAAELGGVAASELGWSCSCGHQCGGYCSITRRLSPARRAQLTAYCVADCETLLAALLGLVRWAEEHDVDLRGTIGGSAWATARRQLLLPDAAYEPAMERRIREAYYGGRSGVYRTAAPNLRQWDMVGAYPAALVEPVPVGDAAELGPRDAQRALTARRPGIYAAKVTVPSSHLPPLPWRYHQRIYYPTGPVAGVWALPELEAAIASGVRVERVYWAVVWPREEPLYADLMQLWSSWRVAAGKDSAVGRWLRLLSNSLIGKLGERGDRKSIRLHPPRKDVRVCIGRAPCSLRRCTGVCGQWEQLDQWGELWAVPYYRQAPSAHVQQAAYATARTRVAWRTEAERHGEDLAYGATDSIWTARRRAPDDVGRELGEWELKDTWVDWSAVAVGAYRGTSARESKLILRTAGARLLPSEWQAGESMQDRGVSSLLAAARSGDGLFVRRSDKWTLPVMGEWCSDRLSGRDGVTSAPTVDRIKKRRLQREESPKPESRGKTQAARSRKGAR